MNLSKIEMGKRLRANIESLLTLLKESEYTDSIRYGLIRRIDEDLFIADYLGILPKDTISYYTTEFYKEYYKEY